MTISQTIDSVPRELLADILHQLETKAVSFVTVGRLRALLDRTDAGISASRPQGEPVAYRYKAGHASWESENPWEPTTLAHGAVLLERKALAANGRFKGDERDHYLELTVEPLYAGQPAPVAVVLPQRRGDYRNPYQAAIGETWNACLDELKRLNPSL